jgi:hypothetical protein
VTVPAYICATCGVQHTPSDAPPERCPICVDERQYIGRGGQSWTTMEELATDHRNVVEEEEPGLLCVRTQPSFAIGQRALVVVTDRGNLMWDCVSLVDEDSVRRLREVGGLQAIAISHPHFYASCIEWSEAFGGAPVYLHAADAEWVMRPSPNVVAWEGDDVEPVPGLALIRLGGHFPGAAVLHWSDGAEGRGVLLSGDTITVVEDRRHVSFMYSYPNLIPLDAATVRGIAHRALGYRFDRIYGAWKPRVVDRDGAGAVRRSAERYEARISGSAG